jgi:hypothetical protein
LAISGAGVIEIEEQGLVERSSRIRPIGSLDEAVLHGLSRRDEVPVDGCVLVPHEHGIAGELSAMVRHDLPDLPHRSTIIVSSRATRRPYPECRASANTVQWRTCQVRNVGCKM